MRIDSWLKLTKDDNLSFDLIKSRLTLPNPAYTSRVKMGFKTTEFDVHGKCQECGKEIKKVYATRKDIPTGCTKCGAGVKYLIKEMDMNRFDAIYKEVGNELWVPRGLVENYGKGEHVEDNTTLGDREVDFKSKIKLGPNEFSTSDQTAFADTFTKALLNGYGSIGQAHPGYGKAQPLCAEVMTPYGIVAMGDIEQGSVVLTPDGGQATVIGVYPQGVVDTYRVTFNDGSSMECSKEHLFAVQNKTDRVNGGTAWRVLTVGEIVKDGLRTPKGRVKWYVPITKPVVFKEQPTDIDPYLLGCLIADGGLTNCSICFSNSEEDILHRVDETLPRGVKRVYTNNGTDYRLVRDGSVSGNVLTEKLKTAGLWGKKSFEKFVPKNYLVNTEAVRRELLAGLFDCDGSVMNRGMAMEYTTSSELLMNDISFLVQSLGGIVSVSSRVPSYTYKGIHKKGRVSFRISITMPKGIVPFKSKKHNSRFRHRTKYDVYRNIVDVSYVGKKPMQCIKLDSEEQLYMTNEFIVTHNTIISLEVIARLKRPTAIIVHKEFLMNQWAERITQCYDINESDIGYVQQDVCDFQGKKIVMIMLQSILAREYSQSLFDYFGTVCIDEVHRIAAQEFRKAIVMFPARYRMGVTATPRRQDNLENVFFWHIGSIAAIGEDSKLKAKVTFVKTPLHPTDRDLRMMTDYRGKQNLNKVIDYLLENDGRNRVIVGLLSKALKSGRKVMVLSGRLDHLERLKNMMDTEMVKSGTRYTTGYYIGGMKEEERTISATRDLIYATYAMASEGLDIPDLDTLFLVTPKTDVEQSVGRILRIVKGKKQPVVIDFSDSIEICISMLRKRVNFYNKMGYIN